jgi:predicted ATP-dependent serine protease
MKKKLKYICSECNARYEGPQGATPFIVAWNDGHFCEPKLIGEQEIKKLSNKTKELVEAELWTTYYN